MMTSACSLFGSDANLTSGVWQWEKFVGSEDESDLDVPNPENFTLTFTDAETVSMKVDCNQAIASYTVDGDSITFESGPKTLAYCGEDSLDTRFMQLISNVISFEISRNQLLLTVNGDESGQMVFSQN